MTIPGTPQTPTPPPSDPPPIAASPAAAPGPAPQPPPVVAPAPTPALVPVVQLDDEDRADGVTVADQHVAVPHAAFRKIKSTAREQGRREQEAVLTRRATALGFGSIEEMFTALETPTREIAMTTPPTTAAPTAQPVPSLVTPAPVAAQPTTPIAAPPGALLTPGTPGADEPENDRRIPDVVRKKLRAAREEMRRTTAAEQARATAAVQDASTARAQLEQFRVEQTMREDLIRAGVKDIEYVWFEVKNQLAKLGADKTPEGEAKLKAFDLKTWADEQRKARPYLFGEQPVPATTGVTPNAPTPAAPTAAAAAGANGDASKVDARTLPPDQFQKRMKELGVKTNGSAPPLAPR